MKCCWLLLSDNKGAHLSFLSFPFKAQHSLDAWAIFMRAIYQCGDHQIHSCETTQGMSVPASQKMRWVPGMLSPTLSGAPFPKDHEVPWRCLSFPRKHALRQRFACMWFGGCVLGNNTCERAKESGWGREVKLRCPQQPQYSQGELWSWSSPR